MRLLAVVLVSTLGVLPFIGFGVPPMPQASPAAEATEFPAGELPADSCDEAVDQVAPDSVKVALASIAEMNVGKFDWPMWGGSNSRVNTPWGKNVPIDWDIGEYRYRYDAINPRTGVVPKGSRNIKWVIPLGSQTYGNPVVANGRIFIGTNNGGRFVQRFTKDLGVLLCFEEQTGRFLWQHSNQKLVTGRVNDWPEQGVCSTPVVDGNRLWYVSNRGEVVCLDTEGFYDDEDDGVPADDVDIGKWVPVCETPAVLHADLEKLRAAFAKAGSKLDRGLGLRRDGERITLGRNKLTSERKRFKWNPLYELQVDKDVVHVFELGSKVNKTPPRRIFSADDDFYPTLRKNQLDDALRKMIEAHTNYVPDNVSLTVLQADWQWELQGSLNGESRTFRLTRENGMLTIAKQRTAKERDEADVVWKLDMINELGVFPHNMSTCSMLIAKGKLFVCTSNGVDEAHVNMPSPRSPSFLALDQRTGKILWEDNSPSDQVMHGQWASPSYGVFNGQAQVIFPGGDGWLYSFDPEGDGNGKARLLWKFDTNPKESVWRLGGRGTRNNIVAFPAIYDGLVYIAVGQDPEHGEGKGHLWCIDPTVRIDGGDVSAQLVVGKDGDVISDRPTAARGLGRDERAVPNPSSAVKWHFTGEDVDGNGEIEDDEAFHRTLSTPVIKDNIMYAADLYGFLHCLDAKTGKSFWHYDTLAACWGSPLLVDGHVYLGDEDGEMHIFKHSSDPSVAFLDSNIPNSDDGRILEFDTSIYGTPIVANNVLYVPTRSSLFAIQHDVDTDDKTKPK